MRKITLGLLTLACVFVSGCFTCVAPFYEDGQIIQDSRIEGVHKNLGAAVFHWQGKYYHCFVQTGFLAPMLRQILGTVGCLPTIQ